MTPTECKARRRALGLSTIEFGRVVGAAPRSVRRWEDGSQDVPRSAEIIVTLIETFPAARKFMGIKPEKP
jgi:DNA-binding transcriptional regulator YiaG